MPTASPTRRNDLSSHGTARLRDARPSDLTALAELERDANVAALAHIFPPELYPYPLGPVRDRWARELADPAFDIRVVELVRPAKTPGGPREATLVGYCACRALPDRNVSAHAAVAAAAQTRAVELLEAAASEVGVVPVEGATLPPGDDLSSPVGSDEAQVWLEHLAVAPFLQGSGLADMLMLDARTRFYGQRMHLWVLTENHRARRFYEREGWVCSGVTSIAPYVPYPPIIEYVAHA